MKRGVIEAKGESKFLLVAGVVFAIVGVLHLYRAFSDWSLRVEDFGIPTWFSGLAGVLILIMAFWAFRLLEKRA